MMMLVAVDFSPVTERIQQTVASLACATGSQVYVVHVAAPEPAFVGYDEGPPVVRKQVARELQHEHEQVGALAQALARCGVQATPLLVQGPTVDMILLEAERLGADLIVVGSHGHGAVYDLLVGSISEGVVRKATVPVLVVPARGPGG
jgi:nucleotide-binding universal stress UspA family protein